MPNWATIVRSALGVALVTSGGFAYFDEEQKLKNRLCDVWFRMTSASERATAGVVAGTGFALRTLEKVMSWLYGPRVISLRGAWSGLMISLAAFPVLAGVTFVLAAPRAGPQLAAKYGVPIVTLVLMLVIGLAGLMTWGLLIAANLPVRFKRFQFTVAGVSDLGTALLISASIITLYLRVSSQRGTSCTRGRASRSCSRSVRSKT